MAAGRSLKTLVSRRRRTDDDGEDGEGIVMVEDSQSEASVLSDLEDGESDPYRGSRTAGNGSAQDTGDSARGKPEAAANGTKPAKKARKRKQQPAKKLAQEQVPEASQPQSAFKAAADTEAMMNGLKVDEQPQEAINFEDLTDDRAPAATPIANGTSTRPVERQRREPDQYKSYRDMNPPFLTARGNYFMHDTRNQSNGQGRLPARAAFQGRARGRGAPFVGGPFSPANQMGREAKAAEQPWKHDLHEAINEETPAPAAPIQDKTDSPQDSPDSARLFPKPAMRTQRQGMTTVISFSSTTLVGRVQIRVSIPGMTKPITYSEVPIKKYIRLPNHRPPLRRDKPVRVSLPDLPVKYIFPSTERSFIFIPRQMRPNQQGYGRYSQQQRSMGGYGYSSRRTSMYGGSVYSASVAPSRRSSLARETSRETAFSPTGSHYSGFPPPSRPVVHLPHGGQYYSTTVSPAGPLSGQQTPNAQLYTYPLPQQPTFQGTPTTTMHQPRPQKAISVSGIESPAVLQQAPQDQQPFQNQLPAHIAPPSSYGHQHQPSYYSPSQGYSYPQQALQTGTPLSGIPEYALHADGFRPPVPYYYPPAPMPMYQQYPPQHNYYMPPQPPQELPEQPLLQGIRSPVSQQQAPSGMVAHESNGMVFYLPASEAQQQPEQQYQPAESFVPNYAMPGLPPPTPAPDPAYYYGMMAPGGGMQEMSQAAYYAQR